MSEPEVKLPKPVFIVSDGTGETAEKVVRAAFRQFHGHVVYLRTFPLVDSPEKLQRIFQKAQRQQAMVVTTLVQREMRSAAARYAKQLGVPHNDVLASLIGAVESFLDRAADGVPRGQQADDAYFRRIEAVEYTVKADDGKEPRMLRDAHIVLVGVSRTSKTPLSTFLAHKGYKVANVPLVLDRPPPDDLYTIDPRKVFALTISPDTLQGIRRSRLKAMGMSSRANYGDIDYILAELEYANELYRSNPQWPVLDVTNKAVEETAATILGLLHEGEDAVKIGDPSQL